MEHGEGGRHRHRTRASRSFDPPGPASNRAGARPAASPVSLLDQAPHRSVRYRKGRLIFEEGDAPTAVFRVDRGCVRLRVCGLDGHRQIVAFLFPGDFLGVGLEVHACGAEAVTDVDLTCYPLQGVHHLSKQSPDVALELLRSADTAFKQLVHHVHLITHLSAHERVLWFLGWLSCSQRRLPGDEVVLPMSHRDVGDFLALSPETLSRCCEACGPTVGSYPRSAVPFRSIHRVRTPAWNPSARARASTGSADARGARALGGMIPPGQSICDPPAC